jgi:hypothetical protein
MTLIGKQLELGAPGALSFLPANSGDPLLFGGFSAFELGLEFIEQHSPGEKTIKRLRPLLLALHANTGRPVMKNNAGRYFINILAAGSGRPNELFFQVLLSNTENLHSVLQEFLFYRRNCVGGHDEVSVHKHRELKLLGGKEFFELAAIEPDAAAIRASIDNH